MNSIWVRLCTEQIVLGQQALFYDVLQQNRSALGLDMKCN